MLTMNDSDVLSVYNNMFSKRENLIFLSYGSRSHHLSTVDAILDEIIMQDKFRHELLCVNVNEDSNVQNSFRNFNNNHGQSRRLFVVDGTEKLTREQLTRNNYLFSVKDPSAHPNIIVLLTWDNQTVPLIEDASSHTSTPRKILKLFGEYLNSEESFMNGPALAGRIDDVFFGVSNEMTESVDMCHDMKSKSISPSTTDLVSRNILDKPLKALIVASLISAVAIYAASSFLNKSPEQEKEQPVRKSKNRSNYSP